jgi:hypothetical protein
MSTVQLETEQHAWESKMARSQDSSVAESKA